MNKKLLSLAVASAVAMPLAASAGSLTVANQDITLSGGIAGGYVYNSDTKRDAFTADDALVDLASNAKVGGVGFDMGVGVLAMPNLASSGAMLSTAGTGTGTAFQYGWLSIMPVDGLKIDAGTLATNVGSEVAPSYANANILRGLVWNHQPVYYNGARATYSMNGMSVYGEVNKAGGPGSALGVSGTFGDYSGAVNFFDVANQGYIVDLIFNGKAGPATFGANVDYTNKAKAVKTPGTDDNAYGVALYGSMAWGAVSLPLRIEYVSDGTSGIYGLTSVTGGTNTAYTLTITPTYNFSDSTFVRAELAYVSTDKKSFAYIDDKGVATDSNLAVALQAGLRF